MRSPYTVEVVRSARRKKTVSARLVGDVVRVQMPAWMSKDEEARYVAHLLGRIERQQQRAPVDVMERAARLATRFDLPRPLRVRWVSNQESLWGSCTVATRDIRVSDRLAGLPGWVLDYVLVHELAHLAVPSHSKRFWSLVNRYPKAERARGFLIAKGMETDEPDGEETAEPRRRAGLNAFGLLLMDDAEARRRHRLESVVADGLATRFARAVLTVVDASQGALDIGELGLDLFEDREVLLALERLGRDIG